jgi:amino acid transporter
VALLTQGVVATAFILTGLIGATVRDAYLALVDTTIILFFIPYGYLFAAYLRLHRRRTPWTVLAGWTGLAATVLSIVLAFWPGPDITRPVFFEIKVWGGVIVFMGVGWVLARRSVRAPTAAAPAAGLR